MSGLEWVGQFDAMRLAASRNGMPGRPSAAVLRARREVLPHADADR